MVSSEERPDNPAAAGKRRKLLVGGAVAALVALALVVTVLSGMWGSSDPAPSSPPGEVQDEERGAYIEMADPCGQIDLTQYQELLPVEIPAVEIQYEPGTRVEAAWQCKAEPLQADDAEGLFLLTGHVYATADEAEQQYQELADSGESTWMDSEATDDESAAEGEWARGLHGYAETDGDSHSLQTIVQDDNLLLNIYFGVEDDAAGVTREDLVNLENATVSELLLQATA